mgnify:FL=1
MFHWKDLVETLGKAMVEVHADGAELSQELEATKDPEGKKLLDQYTAVLKALDTCLDSIQSLKKNGG